MNEEFLQMILNYLSDIESAHAYSSKYANLFTQALSDTLETLHSNEEYTQEMAIKELRRQRVSLMDRVNEIYPEVDFYHQEHEREQYQKDMGK